MQPNEYYNLIVSGQPGHWDQGEGSTSKGRFHYCSVEPVMGRFSPLNDTVEMSLKQFPAIVAYETQCKLPARVGRIKKVQHRHNGYYLHFEFDPAVPPIPNQWLLEHADALDIDNPHRGLGDLDSSHWSVKQVDLYGVLERLGTGSPNREQQWFTAATVLPNEDAGMTLISSGDILGTVPRPRGGFVRTAAQAAAQATAASARADAVLPPAPPVAAAERPRVFIVHGHNQTAKYEVQALLGRLGLEGVILDEQAGRGATIIEKFEREADSVAFAVVLLTPDDKGGVASADAGQLKPRARQNVILELGYFAAKLMRGRVCALRQGSVEIPSDFNGVQYLDYDEGGAWKMALARELRAAGMPVDLNHLC